MATFTLPTPALPTPAPLAESKSLLAKLLAREDIDVVFSPSAETASFNSITRTLVLPVWQNMSESLNDMLVAHEVGHALHTPKTEQELLTAIEEVGGSFSAQAKMYVNVVEDIRIEHEVKAEFPGSRKCFAIGYRELLDGGFFDLNAIPMEERTLCDRINIHSKVGFAVNVPFDSYEQEIVDAAMNTRSWEDVVENAKAIWEYDGTIGRDKIQKIVAEKQENSLSAPGMDGNSDPGGEVENDAPGSGEGEESETETSSSGNENREKPASESENDAKQGSNDQTDNPPSEERGTSKVATENSKEFTPPAAPNSMESLERGLREIRDTKASERMYGVLPTPNLDAMMIGFSTVHQHLSEWIQFNRRDVNISRMIDEAYGTFRRENDKQVTLMVREFERRRAAITHRRNRTGVRGVIDVNRLHSYKFSEDIFKTYTMSRDGKSHAMVMFVDWSSSMSPVIGDTINQTISLASFCRRAGIPFEVYAFSSQPPTSFFDTQHTLEESREIIDNLWSRKEGDLIAHGFSLLNLLSSKMNRREFENGCLNLIMVSDYHGQNEFVIRAKKNFAVATNLMGSSRVNAYGLGGTPLNAAVLSAYDILPMYRKETRAQILTAIFLTDGDATDNILCARYGANGDYSSEATTGTSINRYSVPIYARHRTSKRNFKVADYAYGAGSFTESLLSELRNHTGARVLGFRILHRRWSDMKRKTSRGISIHYDIERLFSAHGNSQIYTSEVLQNLVEKAEKDGVLVVPHSDGKEIPVNPYDELYVFSSKSMSIREQDDLSTLSENASLTKIRNAFMKQSSSGKTSRVFLNRFIPMVAESL